MPLFIKKAHTNGKSYTSGFTGVFVNQLGLGKIPRGTALDPVAKHGGIQAAKDNFGYLDVIHSSSLGILDPLGHVDFYPNGGQKQPGVCLKGKKNCPEFEWRDKNAHKRAPGLYEASIYNPNTFVAWKCPPSLSLKVWRNMGPDRHCSPENGFPNLAHMGEWTTSFGFPEGIYYLTTDDSWPYSWDEMM